MDSWIEILKLLFGQLGVVGTVCFLMSGYLAYLHRQEKEDHKATRQLMEGDLDKRLKIHQEYIQVLTQIKTMMEALLGRR